MEPVHVNQGLFPFSLPPNQPSGLVAMQGLQAHSKWGGLASLVLCQELYPRNTIKILSKLGALEKSHCQAVI